MMKYNMIRQLQRLQQEKDKLLDVFMMCFEKIYLVYLLLPSSLLVGSFCDTIYIEDITDYVCERELKGLLVAVDLVLAKEKKENMKKGASSTNGAMCHGQLVANIEEVMSQLQWLVIAMVKKECKIENLTNSMYGDMRYVPRDKVYIQGCLMYVPENTVYMMRNAMYRPANGMGIMALMNGIYIGVQLTVVCHRCNKLGHMVHFCLDTMKEVECYNYQEMRHIVQNYPKIGMRPSDASTTILYSGSVSHNKTILHNVNVVNRNAVLFIELANKPVLSLVYHVNAIGEEIDVLVNEKWKFNSSVASNTCMVKKVWDQEDDDREEVDSDIENIGTLGSKDKTSSNSDNDDMWVKSKSIRMNKRKGIAKGVIDLITVPQEVR